MSLLLTVVAIAASGTTTVIHEIADAGEAKSVTASTAVTAADPVFETVSWEPMPTMVAAPASVSSEPVVEQDSAALVCMTDYLVCMQTETIFAEMICLQGYEHCMMFCGSSANPNYWAC